MKQTGCAITFLSFFIMAFGACASRPDEVVTILERADCGLLLTQALDRKSSPASVNSSIAFAVDYFEKKIVTNRHAAEHCIWKKKKHRLKRRIGYCNWGL